MPTPHRFTVHYWGGSPGDPSVIPAAKAAMAGWCAPAPVCLRSAVWRLAPSIVGKEPSGAGATAAQGGYLGAIARGAFEPRPFKGIPTVVRLGAPWAWVYRARPHRAVAQGGGGWHAAHPLLFLCAFLLLFTAYSTIVCYCLALIATGACRARRAARDCGIGVR